MSNIILLDLTERIKAAIAENQDDLDAILSTLSGMSGGGCVPKCQVFESSGTWTRPHSGVGLVWALLVGAGGAGYKGSGSTYGGLGGGGGEVVFRPYLLNGNITVTVGTAAEATAGGSSSIATGVMTGVAAGGSKATNTNSSPAVAAGGGTPSGLSDEGMFKQCCSGGGSGGRNASSGQVDSGSCTFYSLGMQSYITSQYGAPGGSSFNSGASSQLVSGGAGITPSGYGGGGGGARGDNTTSYAAGAPGLVVLQWFE